MKLLLAILIMCGLYSCVPTQQPTKPSTTKEYRRVIVIHREVYINGRMHHERHKTKYRKPIHKKNRHH